MRDLDWAVEQKVEDHTVQGSQAWLRWRGKGIGSSDAAVLLGWSPWKTIEQLLEEKLGRWKPTFGVFQERAMERGKELEPVIRRWYEEKMGCLFTEATEEDPEFSYRRASYDGINSTISNGDGSIGKLIEIKAPNKNDHALAMNGMVPDKYMAQVQWLMMVAKVKWCDYVSYGSNDTYAVVSIRADEEIQRELGERAHIFWKHVETKTAITHWDMYEVRFKAPLNLEHVPVKEVSNVDQLDLIKVEEQIKPQEIEAVVADAIEAKKLLDEASVRYDALIEKIKRHLGNQESMRCAQAEFGYTKVKGSVDYSVIPELIGLDLNQFRKPDGKRFYFKKIDLK